MLVDSHAHLDDPRFNEDRDAVLQRAWDAGVRKILTIGNGSGPDAMGCGLPLAEVHDWIYTSVGIHPHDAKHVEPRHYTLMKELSGNDKVIALGETGLDYHYDNSPREPHREVSAPRLPLQGNWIYPSSFTREKQMRTLSRSSSRRLRVEAFSTASHPVMRS